MSWYLEVLKKYAMFDGRARRMEYWMFFLVSFIISIVLAIIDRQVGTAGMGFGILGLLYGLATLIPGIAVAIRRLHDTGRSGWWFLISFIPLIGAIVLIVFLALDGEPGTNAYGPNPKLEPA